MTVPDLSAVTPARIDGAALLDEAVQAFQRYTILPHPLAYSALALYVAYTHAAHVFQYAPRLLVTSAEKRSGKSRVLDIIVALSRSPLVAANATVAAIFRSVGAGDPRTVVFDEADALFGTQTKAEQNEDLRGLINAGFMQGTPVLRTVGQQHTPTEFDVFAPVVMAAIGSLPDTIQDRAINIRMKRRKPSEKVQPYRIRRDAPALHELRDRLAAWVASIEADLGDAYPDSPLEDRAADLWEPLLAIADKAGGRWPALAREAAVALTKTAADDDGDNSAGLELLHDIRVAVAGRRGEWIKTADLVAELARGEESRWAGDALSGRRLADMLRPYGIRPGVVADKSARGYRLDDLTDAFERYLTVQLSEPSESVRAA